MKSLQMIFSESEKLKRQKMGKVVQMKLKSKGNESDIMAQCCEIYGLNKSETQAVKDEVGKLMTEIDYRSSNMYIEAPINQLTDKGKSFNRPLKKACTVILRQCIEKQIYQRQG